MNQRRIQAALAAWLVGGAVAGAGGDEDLSVLFVGHDPEAPQIRFSDDGDARVRALYAERTPAFASFLKDRFGSVQVVYADDYRVAMSDAVDVTIFDAPPVALPSREPEVDAETGEPVYVPPRYLPDDFSRPALMIAACSAEVGESLGLKLDWL